MNPKIMSVFFTTEKGSLSGLDFYTVKSPALKKRADICAFRPKGLREGSPVVILLHGVYGSSWSWTLKAQVHQALTKLIVEELVPPMLLIMPSDGHFDDGSAYLKHQTEDYEKWITEDVISLAREAYPEMTDSSPIFLAGLSMGGYGALRIGAKYPAIFRAFSGLSSITCFSEHEEFLEDFDRLASSVIKQENVIDVLKESKDLQPFRFDCGKRDTLFNANLKLHKQLQHANIPHEFHTYEGDHNWNYWSKHIKETLQFFYKNI
ncbi:MAG: putative tributyrin esterase [Arcticibacterium sp.]